MQTYSSSLNLKKTLLIALLPILMIALYIFFLGVNIPFMDQWEVVPLLEKQQQGQLSISDLVDQHNEHRPFFPRLIWLTLARFTHYNVNAELWVNLLIAIGTFLFFIRMARKTWRELEISTSPFLIPLISLLVFNLGQRESWLQGIQTIMFLEMACVIIGLFTLAADTSWRTFAVAIGLGIIATYSMVSGIFYWVAGLLVLWIVTPRESRALKISIWVVISGICIALFLKGWASSGHLNIAFPFTHPLQWGVWVLNFLGAPLMTSWHVAWWFGGLSVIAFLPLIRHIHGNALWKPLAPYVGIIFFLLLTAVSISLGRAELGLPQSTVSRYLTVSVWYWACLFVLLPLLKIKPLYQWMFYSMVTLSLLALTSIGGWSGYGSLYQRMLPVYQAVTSGQEISDELLGTIYPRPDAARARLVYLCENDLSVCAEIR